MKKIYQDLLNDIPDYKAFLTVDEMDESSRLLAERYPDVVSLNQIGTTREGHPLLCLKIGCGYEQNALMFGLPHPNEPIGTMMMEYFTERLAADAKLRDELGYTWYFVKVWDADGARQNEGWFKGPFTITNYMQNFYRPAGYEQVDWTFPVDYKDLHFHNTLPESKAMMRLIDEVKPKFIYSLHNSGFGGAYWYMTRPAEAETYNALFNVPNKYGVPVHLGEPEDPAAKVFAPAIYSSLGIKSVYDHLLKYGADGAQAAALINCGDCSASYANERYDSFTFLTEVPYFYDARINDTGLSDISRMDAILQKTDEGVRSSKRIAEIADISARYFSEDNHFYLAAKSFTSNPEENAAATRKMVEENPEYSKPATVAEKFDNLLVAKFYGALSYALLLRANESELEKVSGDGECDLEKRSALEAGFAAAKAAFDEVTELLERNMNYSAVPIKSLVGIQLECGLIMAEHLKG